MNIGILYICLGKYNQFFEHFYKSAHENFLINHKKTFFVFTDDPQSKEGKDDVVITYQKKLGWPHDTMKRFHMFNSITDKMENIDYLFFLNANMDFNQEIKEEVIPGEENDYLMGVQHPGFFNKPVDLYPYERRSKSQFYIPYGEGKIYYQGSFNGGRKDEFLNMSFLLEEKMNKDLKNNITPVWHDESALNWYYKDKNPLIVHPGYSYPEMWNLRFDKKIINIDKNKYGGHQHLRS